MATGRTIIRHTRVYMDGYDLSGYSRTIGPLSSTWDYDGQASLTDEIKNGMLGQVAISAGQLNGFFDNTATSGLHVVASTPGVKRTLMVPVGILAAPAAGDVVFNGVFEQKNYYQNGDNNIYATVDFGSWDATSVIGYQNPWGYLLHAKSAETAANTATGIDDRGAATTAGGYMCYQVFAGNGTATIKVQDAATNLNASFADITGATTGSISCTTPSAGIVALATTATVRRYLRWQIALGTATTVTFALSFVRI